MTAARLHDVLDAVARDAPEVRVPDGLYRRARRRRRWRQSCPAVAVAVIVVLSGLVVVDRDPPPAQVAVGGTPGIPDQLVMPPVTTDTVTGSPAGPASVVFGLREDTPLSDNEDFSLSWWHDYSVYPSAVVGLDRDTYRVVRDGVKLSPDGHYLLLGDRRVLNLSTGKTRRVLPSNPHFSDTGTWSPDGRHITYSGGSTTTVVSWPSMRVEWTIKHPDQDYPNSVALAPDGSMAAVQDINALSVYGSDGTRLWTKPLERDWGAGAAAWRADGKLAMFQRTDLVCDDCGDHPGTWHLTFLDALTGTPVDGPVYSAPRSAIRATVVAWRGDTAYAVVGYSTTPPAGRQWRPQDVKVGRVQLVRLRPGAAEPETLLTAPAESDSMDVATDFIETRRLAGPSDFGYNEAEVVGPIVTNVLCLSPFIAVMVWTIARHRRRRRPAIP